MRILLEILRVMFIFLILMAILGTFFENLYLNIGNGAEKNSWISLIAIIILIFVLYRNKFQFSGWYEGEGKEKLPRKVSQILITSSIILILIPPIIAQLN
ncbi:hypothetical protein [Solibacillus daqui]|uniref:hypothetical protein n=1 Tax=Solibacillus daqui TaxID=2912187 RepID=UPI002366EC62|nr:hypothetical protein [Solibacillus daqui]